MASSYIVFDVLPTCNEVSPQEILRLSALMLNRNTLEPEAAFLQQVKPLQHIHENNESCTFLVGSMSSAAAQVDINTVLQLFQQWIQHNQDPRKSQPGVTPVPIFRSKQISDLFVETISQYDISLELSPNPLILREVYAKHFSITTNAMLGTRSIYRKLNINEEEDITEESPFFTFRHPDLKDCCMMVKTLQSLVKCGVNLTS
jgi:hypothetical protein